MSTVTITRDIELGKLPAASLSVVVDILEINEDWKKFVPLIPKTPHSQDRKYNCEEIETMETYAKATKRKFADVLFDEWKTSGKKRATLGLLMELLQEAQIIRAVEEIARMLGEPPPPRPTDGPFASIPTNLPELFNEMSMELRLDSMGTIPSDNIHNSIHDNVPSANTNTQVHEENLMELPNTASNNMGRQAEEDQEVPSTSTSQDRPALTEMLKTPYEDQQSSSSLKSGYTNGTVSDTTVASSSQNESTENDIYEFMGDLYVCEENDLVEE